MNIYEIIQKRYSVRAYQDREVPEKSLQRILEAARLAPSAHNSQPWKFIVVHDENKRKELAQAGLGQDFIAQAPIIIAAVALETEETMSCDVPAAPVNLAIATTHIILAAVEENLATCWIGAFSQEKVKQILKIPAHQKVVALLPLGFPADRPGPKTRKPLEEIVGYEEYS